MPGADCVVSVLAGRAVFEHSADQSCDRFYGWIHRAVRVRSLRGALAHAAAGVCARRVYLRIAGSDDRKESGTRAARYVRRTAGLEAGVPERDDCDQPDADAAAAEREAEPHAALGRASRIWRRAAGGDYGRGVYGALDDAVFLRSGHSGGEWLRPYR